ncbi:MAG: hypothetical protein PHG69_03440, partial [Candidatus Omnitrophica bacterium]|nr:hypothetical protein [Candidatus Omnitrophota bacterium]
MTILILILFAVLAGLIVYALYTMGFLQDMDFLKIKVKGNALPSPEDEIIKLNKQLNSLRKELDKLQVESAAYKKEAERAQRNEMELQEQLLKHKEWTSADKERLERIESQNTETRSEFIKRESELKDEFTKNISLTKEAAVLKKTIQELEEDKKAKLNEIMAFRARVDKYEEDIKKHLKTITEYKIREEKSEFINKDIYNKLKEDYDKLLKEYTGEYGKIERELEVKERRIQQLLMEKVQARQEGAIVAPKPAEPAQPSAIEEKKEVPKEAPAAEQVAPAAAEQVVLPKAPEKPELPAEQPVQEVVPPPQEPPEPAPVEEKPIEQPKEEKPAHEVQQAAPKEKPKPKFNLDKLRNIGIMAHID